MRKVLVVDDDVQIRKLLEVTFELEGFTVIAADCGEKALELATTTTPDVVVCDYMMPRMNGLTLLEQLRARKETASVPFVLVTGSGQQDDARRALKLGADAYVMKPFDPFDLVATVTRVIEAV